MPKIFMLATVLLTAASCTPSHTVSIDASVDGDLEIRNAHLTAACAPDGGPAISIRRFSPPGGRCSGRECAPACGETFAGLTVELLVYDGTSTVLPIVAPVTIVSTASAANGSVTVCFHDGTPCEVTSDFTLRFDSYGGDLTRARLDYGSRGGSALLDAIECGGAPTCD